MNSLLTLTTDYGFKDGYVGALKGAIFAVSTKLTVIDISHQIPPQDCLAAAVALLTATRTFPTGTVHLLVVDPEVGSNRCGLIVSAWEQWFVGPDSGILHFALSAKHNKVYKITAAPAQQTRTTTFAGRDWLGPVAAQLASGTPIQALAEPTTDFALLNLPAPVFEDFRWVGHILHIDHYGNIISDLPAPPIDICSKARVFVGNHPIGPIRKSYAGVEIAKPVATIGALGTVEAGLNCANGQARWQCRRGQKFEILFPERVPAPLYPAWE